VPESTASLGKYDAAKTLEGSSINLCNEMNLESLSDDLVWVERETIQPAHISLWLRLETASKKVEAPG